MSAAGDEMDAAICARYIARALGIACAVLVLAGIVLAWVIWT